MYQLLLSPDPDATRWVDRLPAGVKLVAAISLIVVVVAIPPQHAMLLIAPAVVLAACMATSGVPLVTVGRRILMLEPLALGIAAMAFFQPGGWQIVLLVLARCTLCFVTATLLGATTPLSELIRVLRQLRLPSLLVTTMLLMHRYLFVLVDEAQRMKRARASRTFAPGRRFEWRLLSTVIGQLFVRSVSRADRVYAAMCARGWR